MLENLGQNLKLAAGNKLPIPYIERALVNDSNLTLQISFYIYLEQEQNAEFVTDSLSDVNFYIAQVFDSKVEVSPFHEYSDLEISGSGTLRIDNLTMKHTGVMNYLVDLTKDNYTLDRFVNADSDGYYLNDHKKLIELKINDFNFAGVEYSATSKIIKYTTEVETPVVNIVVAGTSGETDLFLNAEKHNFDLCLVAFSTILDLSGVGSTADVESIELSRTSEGVLNFYNGFFSQVSYEKVFKNGNLNETPTTLYTLQNGRLANGEVAQVIDGTFHLLPAIMMFDGKKGIVDEFQNLSLGIEGGTPAFTEAIDGFNYILSVYGETEELLPRLDLFRKTYLDKSSATAMGKWYLKFNTTLNRINRLVSEGEILQRELVLTPTVVDNRSFSEDQYTPPPDRSSQYNTETAYVFVNDGAIQMGRLGHFDTSVYGATVEQNEFENDYTLMENGYFFFDFEKALKTQSVISKVFGVDPIENFFGKGATNEYFKLKRITVNRKGKDGSLVYSKISEFDDSIDATYPQLTQMYYLNTDGTNTTANSEFNYYDNIIYPELMPRNMAFLTNDALNDYRMMAIQFQDIMPSAGVYDSSPRDSDDVTITVTITDHTKQLISHMTESLMRYLSSSFDEYVSAAEQFCSYNNIDGFFNKFFVDAVSAPFVDDPTTAPWVLSPVIYNIHRDIVTSQFDNDMDKITNASIVINNQISPETGNLDALLKFRNNVQNLITFYENLDLSSYSNEEMLTFGGKTFSMTDFPLPDFLNVTPSLTTTGDDENLEAWNEYATTILSDLKTEMKALWDSQDWTKTAEGEQYSFNQVVTDAGNVLMACETLKDYWENEDISGLTAEEILIGIEKALLAAGVSAILIAPIINAVGIAIGSALFGISGAGAGTALGSLISISAAAGPFAVAVVAVIAIALIITGTIASVKNNFRRDVEQILYDKFNILQAVSEQLNESIEASKTSSATPQNFDDIAIALYGLQPVTMYTMYMLLLLTYSQVDKDYGADILTDENTSYFPLTAEGQQSIAKFIASRALPSKDEFAETVDEDREENEGQSSNRQI